MASRSGGQGRHQSPAIHIKRPPGTKVARKSEKTAGAFKYLFSDNFPGFEALRQIGEIAIKRVIPDPRQQLPDPVDRLIPRRGCRWCACPDFLQEGYDFRTAGVTHVEIVGLVGEARWRTWRRIGVGRRHDG